MIPATQVIVAGGMTMGTLVVLVLVVLVALTVGVFQVTKQLKTKIDQEGAATVRVQCTVKVTRTCVQRLRALSKEPVLLKLDDGILRYQVDSKRMAPVAVAPFETSAALREAGKALTMEFGTQWVAVVQPSAEDALTVDRLA